MLGVTEHARGVAVETIGDGQEKYLIR